MIQGARVTGLVMAEDSLGITAMCCPFCESQNLGLNYFNVECFKCGAQGPEFADKFKNHDERKYNAIRSWNLALRHQKISFKDETP